MSGKGAGPVPAEVAAGRKSISTVATSMNVLRQPVATTRTKGMTAKTALTIIDMQTDFARPGTPLSVSSAR